jgi:protocatechuate 3,4-dioxygenase beta subunit
VVYDFPKDEDTRATVDMSDITLPPMSVMRGLIVDESGQGIPDQLVTLHGWNSDRSHPSGEVAAELIAPSWNAGTDIYVGQRRARTDDLGRFSFADLSAGIYDVLAERKDDSRTITQTVEVRRAAQVDGIRLVLAGGGGTIEGRVVDYLGKPVAKAIVIAAPEEPSITGLPRAETQKDGRFVLRGVQPGAYRVGAQASFWSRESGADPELAPSELRGLQSGQRDLEIVLRRGAWLHGRVLAADGTPVQGVPVVGTTVGSEVHTNTATDASGRFKMLVAEDDLVDLQVRPSRADVDPSGASASHVSPGGEEVILRMPTK